MQFACAVRGIASACLVSMLAACGGGGGGGSNGADDFPAANTVAVNTGTSATPAGSYTLDATTVESELDPTGDGRTIEAARVEDTARKFQLVVAFLQNDTSKYLLYFDSDSGDYVCRSNNVSNAELQALAGGPTMDVSICGGNVKINAGAHNLRASKVTMTDPDTPANKVVISANFSWTI